MSRKFKYRKVSFINKDEVSFDRIDLVFAIEMLLYIALAVLPFLEFLDGLFLHRSFREKDLIFILPPFLFYLTYIFCCSFEYRNKARLGCVIFPIPIINLLSVFICRIIGVLNDVDEQQDKFSQKIEGLVFTIYAKVLFFNEKKAKTLNHPRAYSLVSSYYERQGFKQGLMIDRCNDAIDDGVSIVQASSYLKEALVRYDKAEAVNFVTALFRLIEPIHRPIKKQNNYTGIEKILSKVAAMFELTEDEYYCIVEPFAKKLIKLDMNVAAHSEDFLRKVNEGVKNKKKSELYRSTEFGTISNSRQQSLRKVTKNVRNY